MARAGQSGETNIFTLTTRLFDDEEASTSFYTESWIGVTLVVSAELVDFDKGKHDDLLHRAIDPPHSKPSYDRIANIIGN